MGWSGLMALGEAAKGAGDYFGTLSSEKLKAERLAQARAEQLADKADDRAYSEGQTADGRVYAEGRTTEGRVYAEGQQDEDREYQGKLTAAANARADADAVRDRAQKLEDTKASNDEYDRRLGKTTAADIEKERAKQEAIAAGGGTKTAGDKTREVQVNQALTGLETMTRAMTAGYDPSGARGLVDQSTAGKGVLNVAASKLGQEYQQGARQVKEAFLRSATGAAAPISEQSEYMGMFIPQFGDDDATKATKTEAIKRQIESMAEVSDVEMSDSQAAQLWRDSADRIAADLKLTDTSPSAQAETARAEFKPYQDARGNWINSPDVAPMAANVDDLIAKHRTK